MQKTAERRNANGDVKAEQEGDGGSAAACEAVAATAASPAAAAESPDLYVHRRSSSDIYGSSTSPYRSSSSGGCYAIQTYTSSSHPHRDRRSRSWDLSADPELLRKRRLASYKVYGIEGKVKATVKRSLHWVKGKYNKLVYGFK